MPNSLGLGHGRFIGWMRHTDNTQLFCVTFQQKQTNTSYRRSLHQITTADLKIRDPTYGFLEAFHGPHKFAGDCLFSTKAGLTCVLNTSEKSSYSRSPPYVFRLNSPLLLSWQSHTHTIVGHLEELLCEKQIPTWIFFKTKKAHVKFDLEK